MLKVQRLKKNFGSFSAVSDANIHVAPGKIVAVIGPNGAGKTTLFRLITGQHRPDAGSISFKGVEIGGLPAHRIARAGVSLSYQVVSVFNRLTVFENVQVAVLARQRRVMNLFTPARSLARKETWEILEGVGLTAKAERVSGALSHGDGKLLEVAIALGNHPRLLIMDEPTAGMSPEETAATIELIQRLRDERELTILFCEHDMEMVFAIADGIMVMQHGRTIVQGTCDEVKCNLQVQEAYLGVGA